MVLNRGKFDQDYCAGGEKLFQERDPGQFKPQHRGLTRIRSGKWSGKMKATCHLCEQPTRIKNDGFFVRHKASVKGHTPANFKGSGTPARVRGRQQ